MQEHNKQVVMDFMETAFNAKQPVEAFARCAGEPYVQHNGHAPDGAQACGRLLADFVAEHPAMSIDVRRIFADGDFVITHSVLRTAPDDRGSAAADIFRLHDGRIVEHWDVVAAIPESTVSGNPVV